MTRTKTYMRGDFPYRSIDDIEHANDRAGYYFFSPDTMRGFSSRVLDGVYGGRYFVTSERDRGMYLGGQWCAAWDGKRCYTVREALPSGRVETVSEFGEFATARAARRYAESIAPDHSVYLAGAVVWAHEHADGDWRQAADYYGLTYKPRSQTGRDARERIKRDRAELRRMFCKHARECVVLP